VRELALISIVACFALALAWAHEANLFAIYFAAAAAIAIIEAVRRFVSRRPDDCQSTNNRRGDSVHFVRCGGFHGLW
jgi:hypothetical protein